MTWTGPDILLAANTSTRVWFSWGGAYKGPQFAEAEPNFTYSEDQILVLDHSLSRKVNTWTYWLTCNNPGGTGAVGVWFHLVGGGVS